MSQVEEFKKFRNWIMESQASPEQQAIFDQQAKGVRIRVANKVDDGGCF